MNRHAIAVLGGLFAVAMLVMFYAVVDGGVERAAARHLEQESAAALATPSRPIVAVARGRR
ncbi:MAG: hypothetical protein ABI281_03765 [Caldimonas sp.]